MIKYKSFINFFKRYVNLFNLYCLKGNNIKIFIEILIQIKKFYLIKKINIWEKKESVYEEYLIKNKLF